MLPNQDFKDLFVELNAHGVEFLIVGAHALAAHGRAAALERGGVSHCSRIRSRDERLQPGEPAVSALDAAALPSRSMDVADVTAAGIRLHVAGDHTPDDNDHPSMDEVHAAVADID